MSETLIVGIITGISAILGFGISSLSQGHQHKKQFEFDLQRLAKQFEIDSIREKRKTKTDILIDLRTKLATDLSKFLFVTDLEHYVHERDYQEALQIILRLQLLLKTSKPAELELNAALTGMGHCLTGMTKADSVQYLFTHARVLECGRKVLESLEDI